MPKIIITPWRDESELADVRSKFYPSSSPSGFSPTDQRSDACRIVEAWKLRGHLPHAVEATALLTDAILHDDTTHANNNNSIFSIRATYAAAFSRFVTGLVDNKLGGQYHRGTTMFNRASMIGLPLSFVELRHEAAHRELPSLVLLRSYANRALEWLWDYYWVRIERPYPVDEREGTRVVLKHFVKQVQAEGSKKKVKALVTSVSEALVSICKSDSVEESKAICRILLEDGFIVPKDRQLASSMESLFTTWGPVLQSITDSVKAFLTILTEELAKELNKPNTPADSYLEGVYLWLEHILTSETYKQYKSLLCSINYIRFVCSEWPNYWTNRLAKIIEQEVETVQVDDSLPTRSLPVDMEAPDLQAAGWWF
ncbi:cell morphogenesis protein Las1, putative [Talaromyces stipitatus ATCC 10500]|uniref:Cell morphogenesis protein Las1, putative n=1 Tax=Talaromyces stipitatus (strain ATCC 10500 / CBS 375.48 / QM 6759 / NRRL 1006) TaxID=441959 RepID=B8LST1_TALSN|nr:cell morphogenesis protein Las1, putative [Talaromyces stipitatus ATCC 10500]EED22927.1 cell morphogenesis protein Las1, putative [Talaromyces stipitatus ATCC 10500]